MTTVNSIPKVSLAQWTEGNRSSRLRIASQLAGICHEVGFFYLADHGIGRAAMDVQMSRVKQFFALPEVEKKRIEKAHSPHFRGWEGVGSELTNNEIDYREQLDIGPEREAIDDPDPWYLALVGPNQWPDPGLLPGFRESVTGFIEQLSTLSGQLLRIMSVSLGLRESHMEEMFGANPSPYTKLIRYPAGAETSRGVGIHKDSGFLTLLLQDDQPGLEAQSNSGEWLSVDPIPGTLVVNTGELLQLVTQNFFIATPHRVINRPGRERFSCAFFYSPDLSTPLTPLPIDPRFIEQARLSPRHGSEGLMASRAEMAGGTRSMESRARPAVFGEKYWQRWVRSYPEITRRHYPEWI